MSYSLAQIILAARHNEDRDTGWMQLLVFVILAIFYVVGSILKTKSAKTKQKDEEQEPREPRREVPEGIRGLQKQFIKQPRAATGAEQPAQYRPQVRPRHRKLMRPQPAAQETKSLIEAKLPLSAPLKKPEELVGKPLKDKLLGIASEVAQPESLIEEPLFGFDEPDKLKRAILYYEILGKPLSLREPS